jgi:C-terminal processing protease CtpA/Prc
MLRTSILLGVAALLVPGAALAADVKLGVRLTPTILREEGRGLGVDEVLKGSIAEKLGVKAGSFLWMVKATDDKGKVSYVRTRSPADLARALNSKGATKLTLLWRQAGEWMEASFDLKKETPKPKEDDE